MDQSYWALRPFGFECGMFIKRLVLCLWYHFTTITPLEIIRQSGLELPLEVFVPFYSHNYSHCVIGSECLQMGDLHSTMYPNVFYVETTVHMLWLLLMCEMCYSHFKFVLNIYSVFLIQSFATFKCKVSHSLLAGNLASKEPLHRDFGLFQQHCKHP